MRRTAVRAVLFDLDGTLVETAPSFYRTYLAWLARWLGGSAAASAVLAATDEVRRVSGSEPVGRRILAGIARRTGAGLADLAVAFAEFYRLRYPELRPHVRPIPGAADLLAAAASGGAALCLASDPVFPAEQLLARLRWGGLEPSPLAWAPGCDEMRAVKPDPAYFRDLAARLGVGPGACLLVGNDPERDGAAVRVGMNVFLLEGAAHAVADRAAPGDAPSGAARGTMAAGIERVAAFARGG